MEPTDLPLEQPDPEPLLPAYPTSGEPTDEELTAFVGTKADYYLPRWRASQQRLGGFNFAAFFVSGFWLPYRKMYRTTLLFYGLVLAVCIVEDAALST
jgi:hypothetical protein